ncbi:hypothetical protein ABLN79_00910, partial [Mycobacterium tuberculosis]
MTPFGPCRGDSKARGRALPDAAGANTVGYHRRRVTRAHVVAVLSSEELALPGPASWPPAQRRAAAARWQTRAATDVTHDTSP